MNTHTIQPLSCGEYNCELIGLESVYGIGQIDGGDRSPHDGAMASFSRWAVSEILHEFGEIGWSILLKPKILPLETSVLFVNLKTKPRLPC